MPELGTYGSVRGAAGNSRPYRECRPVMPRAVCAPRAGVGKPPREETAGDEGVAVPGARPMGISAACLLAQSGAKVIRGDDRHG
jgi:hypothetical protein